ncbi:unnamed protein product [Adineta steineri]|uniref:Uncharacterized protein n=1 Tax=Adineta steineri TaxID=433720 RepID=A0A814DHY8_9BILA|nr:unnamed protein product [Adineta steineri]CAF1421218.1 unnamed protein product [Adineta steineri]CAF3537025.1 unnamed protein product [Adineta steineri]CAF3602578.1 unnamed protein product [Adineta steineri]
MTTKTTITLSPIKRCHGSPNLKKRRLTSLSIHRKQQMNLTLPIPTINSSSTILTVSCDKQIMPSIQLPDLINDIVIEQQQRREMIVNIATILRKVGDQVDEQLQINNTSSLSIDHIFNQRTITFVHCLSCILRFFL